MTGKYDRAAFSAQAFVEDFGPAKNKKLKMWERTRLYRPENDEVYFPAVTVGDEVDVVACAIRGLVEFVKLSDHFYLPASWLAKEYPDYASTILKAAKDIRKAAKTPPAASS